MLTYVTIGPLKIWSGPGRAGASTARTARSCSTRPPPAQLAMSYPSGHVANALVWYGVIALLLGALLRSLDRPPLSDGPTWRSGSLPPAIVFCTTTYLASTGSPTRWPACCSAWSWPG